MTEKQNMMLALFSDSIVILREAMTRTFNTTLKNQAIQSENGLYKVSKCHCTFADQEDSPDFYSVNIYLKSYDKNEYLLYDDNTFIKSLQSKFQYFKVEHSEFAAQGKTYVNVDVVVNYEI